MKHRRFGRTNWQVSSVGYGMWGLADWTDTDAKEVEKALDLSVELAAIFMILHGAMEKAKAKTF